MRSIYHCIFLIITLVLISGVAADSLGSYKYTVGPKFSPTTDNATKIGGVVVPAGLGLLTETEILNPYLNLKSKGHWHPLPGVVGMYPVNRNDSDPDLIAGTIYQNGVQVRGFSYTSGIPLKIVSWYITNYTKPTPLDVYVSEYGIIKDVQDEYSLEYSVDFKSFNLNLSQYSPINVTGNWTTNLGLANLKTETITYNGTVTNARPFVNGKLVDGKRIIGSLYGPVWSGRWDSNISDYNHDGLNLYQPGHFLTVFDPTWSSFNGTKGFFNSESGDGVFSGKKLN